MLKHQVGHRAAYAAGLAGHVWEPVWPSDADCERWQPSTRKMSGCGATPSNGPGFRKGLSVDRMRLQLRGGRAVKLIFPTQEGLYPALKQILTDWLGDRLTLK